MAASAEEASVLEDELTCPVCLDLYRDPHLLPCGHNFCLQCLKRLKSRADRGRLRCPECRESHRTSGAWQKNFKLANIAEDYRRRGRAPRPTPAGPARAPATVRCDYCPAEGGEAGPSAAAALAVKTCLKCEVSMCPEHVRPHLELPAFREHPLAEPLGDLRTRKCAEHDEMFRYYCVDEKVCICNACTIVGAHTGHTIKTLKNTMKDMKVSLDKQLQRVDRKISRTEKTVQEHKEEERQNKVFLDDTDQRVAALGDVLRTELDGFLSGLRECGRAHGGESGPGVQQNLTRIGQDQARLQEVHRGIEGLLQETDPFHFLKEYNSTSKRFRRQLRKPLFSPEYSGVDTDALSDSMEAKLEGFVTELRQHVINLIDAVCAVEEGDGEEENGENEEEEEDDDDDDDDEEHDSDEDGDEEAEEEMRSEEEEGPNHSESTDELYSPEEEEEEEEVEEAIFSD